ncbi:N-acetylmuramoyl-L-alanine amidase family protein [Falsiroseomonas selenitidurans]|uniref:N-acetylmuramoyl-L-alanine amidase n=1 Tax=Falsiroseomonas selenitidurans TaxID=2716335 RepID=A0ABX1EBQ9_9PROT|nr:N-acetylmuramoyl-L-alanine amidase [Falsiroseomonas selenitidurans]NKC34436.1 N-acetylmuramoyl-L-alanine amidase [Falsiroseomonas selenitidurans]
MFGRRALASLLLGLAALPAPREALAAVTGATLEADGAVTRLELRLPAGARWRLLAARRPNRLLLETPGTPWRAANRLRAAGRVRAARVERGRLRLDLSGPVALHSARESGGLLVIELVPGTAAAFNRLAAGHGALAQGGGRSPAASLPLVVLDPGHGGRDPGAIGTKGTQEKRVVLAAALQLKRVLEAGGRCRVALTRSNDRFVPLEQRVQFARRRQAALFVSLHADSAPGARGASVYTLGNSSDQLAGALAQRENLADRAGGLNLPAVPPEVQAILMSLVRAETRIGSARMAQRVVAELRQDVALLPNTHRQAGFMVLKAPDVPAVLVEMGFLSDPQDEAALRRPEHRAKLARALGRAVHGWLAQGQEVASARG